MGIKLFPIGYLNDTNDSRGSWTDGGTAETDLFEPNDGCKSTPVDTTLKSESENHAIVTRKKIPIYRNIQYTYKNIWYRHYRILERYYNLVNGQADRFYVVDFSAGQLVTGFKITGGAVTATISDTSSFNTTANKYGYRQMLWKPSQASLVLGRSLSISDNQNISFEASFGDLAAYKDNNIFAYPVCEVLFADNLNNFKSGEFNPEEDEDRGYMMSGNCSFQQFSTG